MYLYLLILFESIFPNPVPVVPQVTDKTDVTFTYLCMFYKVHADSGNINLT